jgi:LmbE family N-acetylglucosaminyl deacetylase
MGGLEANLQPRHERHVIPLTFDISHARLKTVLCLGAHSDDIEIGCGGTILRLAKAYPHLHVHWIVFNSDGTRAGEAMESANLFLQEAQTKNIVIKQFRNSFFPYIGAEIKEFFEELKRDISPDIVFTHYRDDLHQDHRLISELTWNTFRDHLILEYEIPKYDGDIGSPNLFVHLDRKVCQTKIQHILESFQTQQEKQWFSEDTFLSILRLRGVESNAPTKYAEAFYCRKLILQCHPPA